MSEQLKINNDIGKLESDEMHSDEITGDFDMSELMNQAAELAKIRAEAAAEASLLEENNDIGEDESNFVKADSIIGDADQSEIYSQAFAEAEARKAAQEAAVPINSTIETGEVSGEDLDDITHGDRSFSESMLEQSNAAEEASPAVPTAETAEVSEVVDENPDAITLSERDFSEANRAAYDLVENQKPTTEEAVVENQAADNIELTDENSIDGITTSERSFNEIMREQLNAAEEAKPADLTAETDEVNDENPDDITHSEKDFSDANNNQGVYGNAIKLSNAQRNVGNYNGVYGDAIKLSNAQKAANGNSNGVYRQAIELSKEKKDDAAELGNDKNTRAKIGKFVLKKIRTKTAESINPIGSNSGSEQASVANRAEELNQRINQLKQLKLEREARIQSRIEKSKGSTVEKASRLRDGIRSFAFRWLSYKRKLASSRRSNQADNLANENV